MVGCCDGILVYEELIGNPNKLILYNEGVIVAIVEELNMWKSKVKKNVTYNKRNDHKAWIVSFCFCVRRYINDETYFCSHGTYMMVQTISVQEPNVKFVQFSDVESPRDLISHKLTAVESLRNMNNGESYYCNTGVIRPDRWNNLLSFLSTFLSLTFLRYLKQV